MQQIVRDKLLEFLHNNSGEKDFINYFGPLNYLNPKEFTFSCGDIEMIKQMSLYVKSSVKQRDYGYFTGISTNDIDNVLPFRSETDLKKDLFNLISDNLHRKYGAKAAERFKEQMVVVDFENGVVRGSTRCILCESDTQRVNRQKKRNKGTTSIVVFWNGSAWSISNFSKHLKNIHPPLDVINDSCKLQLVNK